MEIIEYLPSEMLVRMWVIKHVREHLTAYHEHFVDVGGHLNMLLVKLNFCLIFCSNDQFYDLRVILRAGGYLVSL